MLWGSSEYESFLPEKIFWLVSKPHPHWVETGKERLKFDFKESGFRQFVDINSRYLITDAILMFGLQYAYETQKLIEALNPIRLTVRMKPGSFLGMSHHFLGAPFEIEQDDILKEFLNEARKILEETGFGKDIAVICFDHSLEENVLENLERINNLSFRFFRD